MCLCLASAGHLESSGSQFQSPDCVWHRLPAAPQCSLRRALPKEQGCLSSFEQSVQKRRAAELARKHQMEKETGGIELRRAKPAQWLTDWNRH